MPFEGWGLPFSIFCQQYFTGSCFSLVQARRTKEFGSNSICSSENPLFLNQSSPECFRPSLTCSLIRNAPRLLRPGGSGHYWVNLIYVIGQLWANEGDKRVARNADIIKKYQAHHLEAIQKQTPRNPSEKNRSVTSEATRSELKSNKWPNSRWPTKGCWNSNHWKT